MKKTIISTLLYITAIVISAQETPKPVIGISCSHPNNSYSQVSRTYTESVLKAGGLPLLIPIIESEKALDEILSLVDALILTGGEDIHPQYYNEAPIPELGKVNEVRDFYDLALIRLASERGMPMLGICRGEQLINVAFGGTLYQDIPSQCADSTVNHRQSISSKYPTHYVKLLSESVIATITGETELATNSFHHQAVKDVAPGFSITGWACDSIPEVIENISGRPIWGVQFHPEGHVAGGDTIMIRFFDFMIEQALEYKKTKQ
ncbi:gamma-glutamyl-gamma-aminobutyrate hydrolase family protein [Bacteroides sp. 214]|uniref:gamma-glutamyl-gamma-aminobutyrate hydrolase family protein n=1 Tax=Bacteroides sp. 214 TaxID=2302935 RepID=UPI0013D398C8|nr:gamma-glutamyl-gamma-aminobutyrate hydrolase family protein [Bacteroides sp. 214]NDW11709.1 gamma-glutamyl-gamma-aminobutyrate hydrolase family protein [Bacteroides sp. 214]